MPYRHPLLRRLYAETIGPDTSHLAGKRLLVTGAGGSIGSVLCRHLLACGPAELVALDAYDGNLWRLGERHRADPRLRLALGSVCDLQRLRDLMAQQTDYVFHCAAAKHVPMLEDQLNTREGRRVNVNGTMNVLIAAEHIGSVVVNCSTDKAAEPRCQMGRQKREAERLLAAWVTRGNRGTSVRLGNVLDSVGSVLPCWRDQIAAGGPIRLTHPHMARYFMTADTAAQCLVAASALGGPGALAIPDFGEPILMASVAAALAYEAGTSLDALGVEEIGPRPGEKLREVLLGDYETATRIPIRTKPQFSGQPKEQVA